MSDQIDMVYVAADPDQPGAGWGIVVDDGKYPHDLARTLAGWIEEGANIVRVDIETGREMLMKWVRPSKHQAQLL